MRDYCCVNSILRMKCILLDINSISQFTALYQNLQIKVMYQLCTCKWFVRKVMSVSRFKNIYGTDRYNTLKGFKIGSYCADISLLARFQVRKQRKVWRRQDCKASGESLAPLNWPENGSWERRCGLARCRSKVSIERRTTACTGDENKFHGKACSYSPDSLKRLNNRSFLSWPLPLPIPTDPNRSECALTYSCFTIRWLPLLFGQSMYD